MPSPAHELQFSTNIGSTSLRSNFEHSIQSEHFFPIVVEIIVYVCKHLYISFLPGGIQSSLQRGGGLITRTDKENKQIWARLYLPKLTMTGPKQQGPWASSGLRAPPRLNTCRNKYLLSIYDLSRGELTYC